MYIKEFIPVIQEIIKIHESRLSAHILDVLQKNTNPSNASRSPELKELFEALAKAQSEMKSAIPSQQNRYFMSRYEDLAEVVNASRPALTKHGLSVIQQIVSNEDGQNILYTILGHTSGQWIESRVRIVPPKNDIQTIHSYTTMLRRLTYASLVGIVVKHEDDDGEIAMVEAREIIAKGPSTKYNPKEQSFETISKEQLQELEYELAGCPDLAEEVMDRMKIRSLADLPKSQYQVSINRIRQIKNLRSGK